MNKNFQHITGITLTDEFKATQQALTTYQIQETTPEQAQAVLDAITALSAAAHKAIQGAKNVILPEAHQTDEGQQAIANGTTADWAEAQDTDFNAQLTASITEPANAIIEDALSVVYGKNQEKIMAAHYKLPIQTL